MPPRYPLNEGLPEYVNAASYDVDNVWGPDDDFYLALAREIGGPVLDVGCGTGRLTIAMAEAGLDVTGLDVTPEMLDRARGKSEHLDIEWVLGDARTMQQGRKYRLITMTSHGFQHLLTDEDIGAFLGRAREHLLDDAYLAFETRNYAARSFGGSEEPALWKTVEDTEGRHVDILFGSTYDPESEIEHLVGERFVRETGERYRSTTNLRYIDVEDLNRMLTDHGFEIVHQYGDWAKGPLGADQPEVVSICRLSSDAATIEARRDS